MLDPYAKAAVSREGPGIVLDTDPAQVAASGAGGCFRYPTGTDGLKKQGYPEEILRQFFEFDTFHLGKKGIQFEVMPERMRGEIARFDISGKDGKTIVAAGKRITVRHIREMQDAGIDKLTVGQDFLVGRVLAHNVIDKDSGEIIASANDEITETLLANLREAGVTTLETLYTNELDRGAFISNTLRIAETGDQLAARLLAPLSRWRRYAETSDQIARERLAEPGAQLRVRIADHDREDARVGARVLPWAVVVEGPHDHHGQ